MRRAPGVPITRMLVPLDGTERSESVLVTAESIATRGSEVALLRVVSNGEDGAPARSRLEAHLKRLEERGARGRVEVARGDVVETILDRARGAALVVMATHGRSRLDRLVRGSVAERVLRRSPAPVLLVSPFASGPTRLPPRRILVPLDAPTDPALDLAIDLAREHGSQLVLFHAVEVRPLDSPVAAAEAISRTWPLLEAARRRIPAEIATTERASMGPAAHAILDAVRVEDADLVCMTTHGRTGARRLVLGSVAESVLRRCPVPLLAWRYVESEPGAIAA